MRAAHDAKGQPYIFYTSTLDWVILAFWLTQSQLCTHRNPIDSLYTKIPVNPARSRIRIFICIRICKIYYY